MNRLSQRISLKEKVGYSLGDASANLIFQMMMMFQLFFYTEVFGIKASIAGFILLFARFFDAFVDPVVGILSDRTNSRWGKYRPWLLWTALPFAVFFVLAFTTPDISERGKIIYAGVTYTLLMAIYSFNNTPYSSLGGVMTSDIKERTSISTIRFITATIATFVVQGLTLPLVTRFGGSSTSAKGWVTTIALFAVIGIVLMVITFFSTKERIMPPEGQKTSVRQDIGDVIRCRPWIAMFVLTFFLFITLSMWNSSMSYYFDNVVDKTALFIFLGKVGLVSTDGIVVGTFPSLLNAFGLIAMPDLSNVYAVGFSLFNMIGQLITLLGVILLSRFLAGIFGKRSVFIVCLSLTALVTALFYVVPSTDVSVVFLLNIARNLAYAPTIPLLWAMMGDVADYSEWKNRRRATGMVFAGVVFALKAGLGVGGALLGGIIQSFGYVSNSVQTDLALTGLRFTSSLLPAGLYLIGVVALCFYPITKKYNQKIQVELNERREQIF
jgi:Na+/melibiose symporter-like transporter